MMHGMYPSYSRFATWLEQNTVTKQLWFPLVGESGSEVPLCQYGFSTNNPCESMNANMNSLPSYLLTKRHWLDVLEALKTLEEMDKGDERKICAFSPYD